MSASLVEKIKDMQRNDEVAREQWYAYCEQYGGDVRDPSKHKDQFITTFVSQFNSGKRLEFQGAVALAKYIKMGQSKSPQWKACWHQYCQTSEAPKEHDPAKHNFFFLEGFFDFIGKMAMNGNMGMGMGMGMMGGMSIASIEPPKKKFKVSGSLMSQEIMKDQLVIQVKSFQRASEEQKNVWHNFCDTHLEGHRDPARADVETLQFFLNTQVEGSDGLSMPTSPRPALGNSYSSLPSAGPSLSLVQQVKAFQRQGDVEKNAWHAFCDNNLGGNRDPARADLETLQHFLSIHGISSKISPLLV